MNLKYLKLSWLILLLIAAGHAASGQSVLNNRLHYGESKPEAGNTLAFASANTNSSESASVEIVLTPPISRPGYYKSHKPELSPCERIRRQRGNARVGFIAGAGAGLLLTALGVQIALDHLFSNGNEGSAETALGLVVFTGSIVGYCVTVPKLSRKYHRCK